VGGDDAQGEAERAAQVRVDRVFRNKLAAAGELNQFDG